MNQTTAPDAVISDLRFHETVMVHITSRALRSVTKRTNWTVERLVSSDDRS